MKKYISIFVTILIVGIVFFSFNKEKMSSFITQQIFKSEHLVNSNDIQEKINNADLNDIIKLSSNIDLESTITIPSSKNITIDLNGYYISDSTNVPLKNEGTLTIISSKNKGSVSSTEDYALSNSGTLTILSGTFSSTATSAINNTGTLTIGDPNKEINEDVIINGGIDNPTIYNNHIVKFYNGKIKVADEDQETIKNDTKNQIVLREGYKTIEDDGYLILKRYNLAWAANGIEYYWCDDLQEAIRDTDDNDTIKLYNDLNVEEIQTTISKNLTIDLNGHNILFNNGKGIENSRKLKITDSSSNSKLGYIYATDEVIDNKKTGEIEIEKVNYLISEWATTIKNEGKITILSGSVKTTQETAIENSGNLIIGDINADIKEDPIIKAKINNENGTLNFYNGKIKYDEKEHPFGNISGIINYRTGYGSIFEGDYIIPAKLYNLQIEVGDYIQNATLNYDEVDFKSYCAQKDKCIIIRPHNLDLHLSVDTESDEDNPGYKIVFDGWSYADGSKEIKDIDLKEKILDFKMPAGDVHLKVSAHREAIAYTVTLEANEGQLKEKNVTVKYMENYADLPTPTRKGYKFKGWQDESGNIIDENTKYTYTKNTTLTAQWEEIKYKVIYNGNEGYIDDQETYELEYKKDQLNNAISSDMSEKAIRQGYKFIGWSLNPDSYYSQSTELIQKIDLEDFDGETTLNLYAIWDKKYKIIYDQNTGIGDNVSQEFTNYEIETTRVKYKNNTYTKTGYKFKCWNSSANGNGEENIVEGQEITDSLFENYSVTLKGDFYEIVLYSQWQAREYTVTYNANEGSVTPASKKVTYDQKYGDLPTPTRKGYKFKGWQDESGNAVNKNTIYQIANDSKLIAQWAKYYDLELSLGNYVNSINIIVDGKTEKFSGTIKGSIKIVEGEEVGLKANLLTKKGYTTTFTEWTCHDEPCLVDSAYRTNSETTFKMPSGNVYLTPEAQEPVANHYTVTLNADGGNVDNATQDVTYNSPYGQLPVPTKSGYKFKGWQDKEGNIVNENTKYTYTENTTLTAQWEAIIYLKLKNDATYNMDNNLIINVNEKTSKSDFLKQFDIFNARIYEPDAKVENGSIKGNEFNSGYISTGMLIVPNKTNIDDEVYHIIVRGDLTSDGLVKINDITKVYKYILKTNSLDKFQIKAADVTNDNAIKINDLTKIYKYVLKLLKDL